MEFCTGWKDIAELAKTKKYKIPTKENRNQITHSKILKQLQPIQNQL